MLRYFKKFEIIFFLIIFLSATGLAKEWDNLTKDEIEKLKRGEVIYKSVKYTNDKGEISGFGQSMALIKSPVEKCWHIFTQFDKQQEYFPRKTASIVLEQKPGFALIKKRFKFFWKEIEYVVRYRIDEKNYRIDYNLDHSMPADIKDTAGYFLFEKVSQDETLFIYAVTKVDTGLNMPEFVQEFLQKRDLPKVAENVRKRIETGWKKEKED